MLAYCGAVACNPDPGDPEAVKRQAEDLRASERRVDERLDPYSGRYFPREARTEVLQGVVRREREVERIVRRRVWGVLGERCGGGFDGDEIETGVRVDGEEAWEGALRAWRERISNGSDSRGGVIEARR